MRKSTTIIDFFKRKNTNNSEVNTDDASESTPSVDIPISDNLQTKFRRIETDEIDANSLERNPELCLQIWDYHVNQRDKIRRAYTKLGPFQPCLQEYERSGLEGHLCRFQSSWFNIFPSWLEYSPTKDAAFCLFSKPSGNSEQTAFIIERFKNWKKVRDGTHCAFLTHIGKDHNLFHRVAEKAWDDLMKQTQHITNVYDKFDFEDIANNRLRLKNSIIVVRVLAFQGIAFRGRDESSSSMNHGNFREILDVVVSNNEKVAKLVAKALKNALYISPKIQKDILHVFSNKVKKEIREEIGDSKFCIIVDEARNESTKEQTPIVLRFVDKDGFIRERFFGLVHVSDTASLTLKNEIYSILSHHNLDIQNIRGQRYDGASNMRDEWNGLQALVSNDCPYAYYVHCFAHRLQLALVAASREVIPIHHFFTKLTFIVNGVCASCKRNEQLKVAQAAEIAHMIDLGDLEIGKGLNQIGTLQRAGNTHWSSHLRSISSLMTKFSATFEVLLIIIEEGNTFFKRGEADAAY